ncbi:hypothetical protein BJ912DRAFT_451324 [Pholiota molesta]|nr:hypothetical protein BJ912DRAFT_451324 [Pholiota molesta]
MMINESSQPQSPINELPTEILCDIFSRCVDQSSARVPMQPNTNIAPMSLCHVCSTWRAAMLSIPSFWSHLRFELPLNWHSNGGPYTWDSELFARRLEWLRWWRRNLGTIEPYLQVEVRRKESVEYHGRRLSESACEFLLELMSSAQYISVGLLYRYLIQWRKEGGYVVKPHPKAHTIVSTWTSVFEFDDVWSYNQHLISVLTQNPSTLRSITIENTKFGPQESRGVQKKCQIYEVEKFG